MPHNITEQFIDDIYNLAQSQYPEPVIHQAKKCLLDYLGCTLAGSRMIQEKGNKLLKYLGAEQGDATVIGFNRKTNMQNAALINGLSSHVAELDDGMRFGMLHPGAPVISALLPLVEHEKLNAADLLKGIVIGYETAIRIASAIQPSHKEQGYHATGTCGAIGAALGVAAALGFSKPEMENALGAAATGGSGLLKAIDDESELKPFNIGRAAVCGLMSAFLARSGFKGPKDVLEGNRGFFPVMSGQHDLAALEKNAEDPYAIEQIYVKPYAACRHCHSPVGAALNIRSKTNITPKEINEIKVMTYSWAVGGHDHTQIDGVSAAKMSIPYSVAVALVTGKAGLDEFTTEYIANPAVNDLTKKVKVFDDKELTALVPQKRAAVVEITKHNNETYRERIDLPKGEPENPVTEEELKEKFISLTLYSNKTEQDAKDIIRHIWNIEKDMDKLFDLL